MVASDVLCDLLCFDIDSVDFGNDVSILLDDFQEKESEFCADDFDLDRADIPSRDDAALNEIPQIVFVLGNDVLVAIHKPVLPSTSTYSFTNFENHCQNLC